jgi:uncharacterized protein (DUF1697 family)
MPAFVALFRGINVGGKVVKMAELSDMHAALGFHNVVTHIQSGNVIFTSAALEAASPAQSIAEAFAARFGFRSEVIVRAAADYRAGMALNPFANQSDKAPNRILLMFLASWPDAARQAALLRAYSGPETIMFAGRDLYLYYPDGVGRSKLTGALIEKTLQTPGTARNWNTVTRIGELLTQAEENAGG